jgi:hypothetical protein
VALSGERKTTADNLAMRPVRENERAMAARHEEDRHTHEIEVTAWEKQRAHDLKRAKTQAEKRSALMDLGQKPETLPPPLLVAPEPTIEGIHRLFAEGVASLGLFATEGGQFLGGHGMSTDHRLKTAAALSAQWDGEPIRRVRAGDGARRLAGRRLSLHLQVQPRVAQEILADEDLIDQGLPSRILVAAPDSTAGTRFWRDPPADAEDRLNRFSEAVANLLRRQPRCLPGEQRVLDPAVVTLNADARQLWIAFADEVERSLGPDGELAQIRGLASKLPEHAARLAVVMAAVERPELSHLNGEDLARGISLARYYATEALRVHEARCADPDIELAVRTLEWLHSTGKRQVALVNIYQSGPRVVRDAKTAKKAVKVLVEHGYLTPLPPGTEIDGHARRAAWEVVEC